MKNQSAEEKLAERVEWLAGILRGAAIGLICIGIALPAIGEWLWGGALGYACFSLMGVGLLFALGYGYLLFVFREYERNKPAHQEAENV